MHDFALVLLRRGHLKIMVQILGFVGYCLSREHACSPLSQQVPQGEMISVVSLSSLTGGCRRHLSSSPPLPPLLRLLPPPHLPFLFPFFSWYKRSNPRPLHARKYCPLSYASAGHLCIFFRKCPLRSAVLPVVVVIWFGVSCSRVV